MIIQPYDIAKKGTCLKCVCVSVRISIGDKEKDIELKNKIKKLLRLIYLSKHQINYMISQKQTYILLLISNMYMGRLLGKY